MIRGGVVCRVRSFVRAVFFGVPIALPFLCFPASALAFENPPADSLMLPEPKSSTVAAEVALGSVLAAVLGYGVGLLAEQLFCDSCDAGEPGGDTPGLVVGVPIGATLGVWIAGRHDAPPGRIADTYLGALVGTAVFAGFASLLEEQPDVVRWSGVVFTGSFAALAWHHSRPRMPRSEHQSWLVPRLGSDPGITLVVRF